MATSKHDRDNADFIKNSHKKLRILTEKHGNFDDAWKEYWGEGVKLTVKFWDFCGHFCDYFLAYF